MPDLPRAYASQELPGVSPIAYLPAAGQDSSPAQSKASDTKTIFERAKGWAIGITGVLVVLPALVNSVYDVYTALAKVPKTETQKINDELFRKYFNKQPVWSFPVPVKREAGTVEAVFAVYEGGDVYIEFGKRSQWFPFPSLEKASGDSLPFISAAFAHETGRTGAGSFEQTDRIVNGKLVRERRWENGVLEIITLDPRSGNIVDRKLSTWESSGRALSSSKGDQARWLAAVDQDTFGSVPLHRFGDSYYATLSPVEWQSNSSGADLPRVQVPRGFVTEMGSVPRVFWSVLRPESYFVYASIVHDYLYWEQRTSREVADRIFREMLLELKTPPSQVDLLYSTTRAFGQSAWDANARAKQGGERRVVARLPEGSRMTWQEWRARPEAFR